MSTTASVKLGSKTVSVREMTLQEIHDLTTTDYASDAGPICALLETSCGLTRDDIMVYAPSELAELVDKMIEVNQSFFDQAAAIGMDAAATSMQKMIKAVFTLAFLPSSNQGTAPASGTTPTPSS